MPLPPSNVMIPPSQGARIKCHHLVHVSTTAVPGKTFCHAGSKAGFLLPSNPNPKKSGIFSVIPIHATANMSASNAQAWLNSVVA